MAQVRESTAPPCPRMPPRSHTSSTTAATPAPCSASCAGGGLSFIRAMWMLPVDGPVTKILHSADGHWLACEVAPAGSERSQIWVVTTDPDDRMARRIDVEDASAGPIWSAGTAPGSPPCSWARTASGSSCLIDPADGNRIVLDRRSGGRLVDAWAGASLVRVGPRGFHELIMLHGLTEIALLPSDPGSVTDTGVILDDRQPRRIRYGPDGRADEAVPPGQDVWRQQPGRLCPCADSQ